MCLCHGALYKFVELAGVFLLYGSAPKNTFHLSFFFFLDAVTEVLPGRGRCKRIDNKHVRFNQKK